MDPVKIRYEVDTLENLNGGILTRAIYDSKTAAMKRAKADSKNARRVDVTRIHYTVTDGEIEYVSVEQIAQFTNE